MTPADFKLWLAQEARRLYLHAREHRLGEHDIHEALREVARRARRSGGAKRRLGPQSLQRSARLDGRTSSTGCSSRTRRWR